MLKKFNQKTFTLMVIEIFGIFFISISFLAIPEDVRTIESGPFFVHTWKRIRRFSAQMQSRSRHRQDVTYLSCSEKSHVFVYSTSTQALALITEKLLWHHSRWFSPVFHPQIFVLFLFVSFLLLLCVRNFIDTPTFNPLEDILCFSGRSVDKTSHTAPPE